MKIWGIFFLAFLLFFRVPGQARGNKSVRTMGLLKAVLTDSSGNTGLSDATVSLTPLNDSADIQYVTTDRRGNFLMKKIISPTPCKRKRPVFFQETGAAEEI